MRSQAQSNAKLKTTKQQKVTVNQEANKQVIEIEPASPEVVTTKLELLRELIKTEWVDCRTEALLESIRKDVEGLRA